MKSLIAAVLMIGMAFSANASEKCVAAAELANTVMQTRQLGVSIVKAMELAGDNRAVRAIVALAYSKPRYSTEQFQQEARTDFETEVYLICIRQK